MVFDYNLIPYWAKNNISKIKMMGLFNSVFGQSKEREDKFSFWIPIGTTDDWESAKLKSFEQKIAIFKHSTRCGISTRVKSNFEKEVQETNPPVIFYYLDLLAHRDISALIASDLGIIHQSPQLIVLENGKIKSHASHSDISIDLL
jgi:bacillithiol system protein YtxJ